MSDTVKRPYRLVLRVAEVFAANLAPVCQRIEIAGSLRRQKQMVGDIEIVAIPKLAQEVQTNLLGEISGQSTTNLVDEALAGWPVTFHKNGPKYKQFSFEWQPGWTFKVDLFLQPDPATWGWNFMIRTGSADFSKKMVTPQKFGGFRPDHLTVNMARIWNDGVPIEAPEEADVFRVWGMDFIDPKDRH